MSRPRVLPHYEAGSSEYPEDSVIEYRYPADLPILASPFISWDNLDCVARFRRPQDADPLEVHLRGIERVLSSQKPLAGDALWPVGQADAIPTQVRERVDALESRARAEGFYVDRAVREYDGAKSDFLIVGLPALFGELFNLEAVAAVYEYMFDHYEDKPGSYSRDGLMAASFVRAWANRPIFDGWDPGVGGLHSALMLACRPGALALAGLALGYPVESTVGEIWR